MPVCQRLDPTFSGSLVACEEVGILGPHIADSSTDMSVDPVGQHALDDRQYVLGQHLAAGHPLVVGTPAMVIGAIQAGTWEQLLQPAKDRFVPDMHPESDLRLLPIPAEVPLADK